MTRKIAILHDDPAVAGVVAECAPRMDLETARADSVEGLQTLLRAGGLRAAVLDVTGPKGGGFELIERICAAGACAVVVTQLDAKTVQSTERLARAKKLDVCIVQKSAFDADRLQTCLAAETEDASDLTVPSLQESIQQNFLRVEYQPKVPFDPDASDDYAVEALVRLRHPELGDVYPDQFISVAEKSGLIQQLTDAVTRQAFADIAAWRKAGLDLRVALNVSPLLLNDSVWSNLFLERCEEFGVGPDHVSLEITESSMGAENHAALEVLTRLRLKGFTLSIDDFGTGFSSLANLYKLPFGELKLDKSFVMDLGQSEEAATLIETTVAMASRIGLKVVAEGVEDEAAFQQLRAYGCHYAQGYFIARPMPASRVPAFFEEWSGRAPAPRQDGDDDATMTAPTGGKVGVIQSLLSDIMGAGDEGDESDATLVLDEAEPGRSEDDPVKAVVAKIPALVMQNRTAEALSACHEALLCLESGEGPDGAAGKLAQMEAVLEKELLCADPIELDFGGGRTVRLLAGRPAVMGRGSEGSAVDIATTCRWFSRGERNLSIYPKDGQWFVEDLGSTNGNLLGDAPLPAGQPAPLGEEGAELRIGRDRASAPPVRLELARPARDSGAVVARLAVEEDRIGEAAAEIRWTTWAEETAMRWVLFEGAVSIGAGEGCAIQAPHAEDEVTAEIMFDGGYWIRPAGGAPVVIGGVAFHKAAPLPPNAEIAAGGARFICRRTDPAAPAAAQPRAPAARSA